MSPPKCYIGGKFVQQSYGDKTAIVCVRMRISLCTCACVDSYTTVGSSVKREREETAADIPT